LALVLGGVLLFFGAGAGLAVWCLGLLDREGPNPGERHDRTRAADGRPAPDTKKAGRPASASKPKAFRLPALPKDKQIQVNQAIDRGVRFLKSSQRADGGWAVVGGRPPHAVGSAALPGLTLLECGVPGTDPAVVKAGEYVRARAVPLTGTYDLALAVLFLDRLGQRDKDRELIRTLLLRLVAGQTGKGGWGYRCPRLGEPEQKQLGALLHELRTQVGEPVPKLTRGDVTALPAPLSKLALLRGEPDFSVPVDPNQAQANYDDNSNTQFAVLALLTASQYDVPVGRTLALAVKRFRATQQANGSWGYHFTGNTHWSRFPTMTCAGLLGLAVGHGLVQDAQGRGQKLQNLTAAAAPAEDGNVQKALHWLGGHIGGGMDDQPDLYYLWSVERVGVIFRLARIGGKEWYPWGVNLLLASQQAAGSWQGRRYFASAPPVDTSLALLFLKRADLAKDLTGKLQTEAQR
jgi:hypothetical protein